MTLSEIKTICNRSSNEWMSEKEYMVLDSFTDMVYQAWNEWEDEITRPFWEGDAKPLSYTESFREDFFNNMDWEEDFGKFLNTEDMKTLDYAAIAAALDTKNTDNFRKGLDLVIAEATTREMDTEDVLDWCGDKLTVTTSPKMATDYLWYSDFQGDNEVFNLRTGELLNEKQVISFLKKHC